MSVGRTIKVARLYKTRYTADPQLRNDARIVLAADLANADED